MTRFVATLLALCISLGAIVESHAKGPLRTLTGIYVGAKTIKGGFRIARAAPEVAKRANLIRKAIRDVEIVSGRKMTRQQFSHIRKCLQAPQSCLDPNSARNWPKQRERVLADWVKNENRGRTPQNRVSWPTYPNDVVGPRGKIASKGSQFDGHHYIPKSVGGPNEAWNIVPVPRPIHQSIIHR